MPRPSPNTVWLVSEIDTSTTAICAPRPETLAVTMDSPLGVLKYETLYSTVPFISSVSWFIEVLAALTSAKSTAVVIASV